jgi:hypothetical protein
MSTETWLVAVNVGAEGEVFSFPSKQKRDDFIAVMEKHNVRWAIPAEDLTYAHGRAVN